jgi:hypothetical protein
MTEHFKQKVESIKEVRLKALEQMKLILFNQRVGRMNHETEKRKAL